MKIIDVRGLSCPQPVILLKQALADAPDTCQVITDNPVSKENVTRFGIKSGYEVTATKQNGDHYLNFVKKQ